MSREATRKRAQADYEAGMTYKDISHKYNVSQNTLSTWKKRFNWIRPPKPKKEPVKEKGKRGAPKRNTNSVKHGYYSKYLPEETKELLQHIDPDNPLDLLWAGIQVQWAAIIRSQNIMYVKDKEDLTVTKVGESKGKVCSETWEVQQAWDKQASFLNAQSNALSKLFSMIRQYEEALHKNWDYATVEQRLRIAKLKTEVEKLQGNNTSGNQLAEAAKKMHERINNEES